MLNPAPDEGGAPGKYGLGAAPGGLGAVCQPPGTSHTPGAHTSRAAFLGGPCLAIS